MARVILGVVAFALAVYALIDCAQTDRTRIRNLPKAGWIAVIALVLVAGPVAWFLGGRPRSHPPRNGGASGPRGPEDDPDFLRNL